MPALYDRIGVGYDGTRRADPKIVDTLAGWLCPEAGGRYLDLACGTGNYTEALARRGGRWTGLDASEQMLGAARARSDGIAWTKGDVHALPFPDAYFDGVLCTLAIHHFADRTRAFAEVRRVLRGRWFVSFVCEAARTQDFWLREYFPEMFVRMEDAEPSEAEMLAELHTAGFGKVETRPFTVPPDLEDQFLYVGKHRPQLYFDPAVRAGISSFANLSEPAEVEAGLARLRSDLDAGRFPAVAAAHRSTAGDYLFLRASPAEEAPGLR